MNIVVAIMLYPYGVRSRGYSYDYYNIFLPLQELSREAQLFDFYSVFQQLGQARMNKAFLDLVAEKKPDVVLVVPYTDQFYPDTIATVSRVCPILAYYHDDLWRSAYCQYWARFYTYVVSTDPHGPSRFRSAGFNNAIYSQRGCNHHVYFPDNRVDHDLDVTFVGGYAPYRGWMVNRLRRAGIGVCTYGAGWPTAGLMSFVGAGIRRRLRRVGLSVPTPPDGHISQDAMVDIFRRSKINLNLSNNLSWDARYLASSPRAIVNTLRSQKDREQIKGRHFEIAGCGGFQLSHYVEGLETCYDTGKEIVVFADPVELVEKTVYYLEHDQERNEIAARGLARTLREHTIVQRLADVLRHAGLAIS